MLKKIMLGLGALLVIAIAAVWLIYIQPLKTVADRFSIDTAPAELALQDDAKVTMPPLQNNPAQTAPNPQNNLYWGELHLHTTESFDSILFGNTLGIEDAYRFAKGHPLTSAGGEVMQLARPLDFVAITDHAEGFGTRTRCKNPDLSVGDKAACWLVDQPNPLVFTIGVGAIRGTAEPGDPTKPAGVYQKTARTPPARGRFPTCMMGTGSPERCAQDAKTDWARYVDLANRYNEPGTLTTLIAYEFSPGLPDQGKHHRNVIFRSSDVPDHAISSFDVPNAISLWRELEADCADECDFLTIPHNPNKAWGLTYSRYTWDGQDYNEDAWRLRQRREPLAEIFQIKGASECALGVGATDEECAFEQVLQPCEPGELSGCAFQTGFIRQGLKVGLALEQELGFNPLQVGMIAATDNHNANPGDVEEWDYRGTAGAVTSPAIRRFHEEYPDGKPYKSRLKFNTPGGIAAVWATENTRAAIFDALARRETYATSGPRMAVRVFAGWDIDDSVLTQPDPVAALTKTASHSGALSPNAVHPNIVPASIVPMGSVLRPGADQTQAPGFFVWATRDQIDAPLQKMQMVKGWIDSDGQTHEAVVDIACADRLSVDPATGRCPDNGATVDLATCAISGDVGADELKTVWRDPDYQAGQNAFYYVRVLQNPTCRWSTYDAIRLGRAPDPRAPSHTIRERAWTSPIWVNSK